MRADHTLRVWINDEWANEGSDLVSGRPGELIFHDASTGCESLQPCEGWISEVHIDDLGRFILDFCDRDQLTISAAGAVWAPAGES
jgi:hypothetical protein